MEDKSKNFLGFAILLFLLILLLVVVTKPFLSLDSQSKDNVLQVMPTELPKPTTVIVIFDPPERARIISDNKIDFVLAGNNVEYLTEYEKLRPNSTKARAMMNDQEVVHYLSVNVKVWLLKYEDEYARVKLMENNFNLKPGSLVWVHKKNVIPSW